MDEFIQRYKDLNAAQKEAVDTIDGPLMVIAGPGTGKTELLSMRAANILQKTDALPENILCLTFTESGAQAMRERLTGIIGADAYKVAIHTFHSFGSEIININRKFFYNGAEFRPADELSRYEILREILDELPFSNPLTSKMNGEYTYLGDIVTTISELKKSGLTSDELLTVLEANDAVLDKFEPIFHDIFQDRVSKTTTAKVEALSLQLADYPTLPLPPNITPLANTMALSLAHAVDEAADTSSTKPITAWKNKWLEKNANGKIVFKDRSRHEKLRAVSFVYFQYLQRMQEASLYDFDDMVLRVVHALEVFPELRYNLQEKYLYLMVDEFQDTNLAQARILTSLTALETGDAPNIMVVGDDDQAIYSFQGAEVRNIMHFKQQFEGTKLVVLTENYRSTKTILDHSREVILKGNDRLEKYEPELDKSLTSTVKNAATAVELREYPTRTAERQQLVNTIKMRIKNGAKPEQIAVLTRRHKELEALVPYFERVGLSVNYERRDNVLELDVIRQLTLLGTIIVLVAQKRLDEADELLPELLAHPAWKINADEIWKLSLAAHKNHAGWLEEMAVQPRFVLLHRWLVFMATRSLIEPAERVLDELIGSQSVGKTEFEYEHTTLDVTEFVSPLYEHYFSDDIRVTNFNAYLIHLEALRAIRNKLREYKPNETLLLADFIAFIELHRQQGSGITSVRVHSDAPKNSVWLMTAHKSKGLEFDHVYIHGAVDGVWGEKARSRSRLITYPENLQLSPSGDTLDERLRLFFVAMTRARRHLTISYATADDSDKPMMRASFLVDDTWKPLVQNGVASQKQTALQLTQDWMQTYTTLPSGEMKQLLQPTLERYKLSATHLNAFLDVSRGGPNYFLLSNLLRFPQSMSANAAYGSAIHRTLQHTHAEFQATGKRRPIEDILGDFETNLKNMYLSPREHTQFSERGLLALATFLEATYQNFEQNDIAELSFSNQQSRIGEAHLTGALDVVRIDTNEKTLAVTDYKTGSPSRGWQGTTDYEKIKLHKYRQQLMFYKLLVEHSRDFANYTVDEAKLQFVEPTKTGQIHELTMRFDKDELARFQRLILKVWSHITAVDLPDTSEYSPDYKGMLAFEAALLDEN